MHNAAVSGKTNKEVPADETRIFDFLTKEQKEQLEVADRNGWIIMLHIPRPGRLKDKVNLAELMAIEEKYPNVKLIVAFMRLYRITENGTYINVVPKGYYGDVSDVTNIRESENEDITLMLYEQLRAFKKSAMDMKLSDADIEDIMYNNAKKLFM